MRFSYSLLLFLIIFKSVLGVNYTSLCFSQKSKNQCYCSYEEDEIINEVLYTMDCSRTKTVTFPNYYQMVDVEKIDLSFNNIEKLEGSASSIENVIVVSLKLSNNNIYYVGTEYFKNFMNLKVLDLSHNELANFANSNLFSGLSKLEVLDLSYNVLSTLPNQIFTPLSALLDLDISYNYLKETLNNINNLYDSNLGLSKNLNKLKMENLDIDTIPHSFFEGNDKLTHLSLADNPLAEIPIFIPYSVTYLDLSGTLVTVLAGKVLNFHSLKVLKLNRLKRLQKIDEYAFYNLQSLEELEMNDNPNLKELNSIAFGDLSKKMMETHMKKMSVARSSLKRIDETFKFLFENLEKIDFEGNFLSCDCDIFWLQKFEDKLRRKDSLRCFNPARLRTKNIMELKLKDIPRCESNQNKKQKVIIIVLSVLLCVLFVLVIYLYYLGPFQYKNDYRGIGPESPYRNMINIQPNQAESS